MHNNKNKNGCLAVFLAGILAICGLWGLVILDRRTSLQVALDKLGPCLSGGNVVAIVDTDYARHGNKTANYVTERVVTCETKSGHRFNICQELHPDHIPLVGEHWEIRQITGTDSAYLMFLRRVE